MKLTIKNATPTQIANSLSIQQIESLLQQACINATLCTIKERTQKEQTAEKIKQALDIANLIKG
jgi:hypothetical protein